MKSESNDRLTLAAFAASILFGGFNSIGVHLMVQEISPFWGAVLRFAPASLLLFGLMMLRRTPLPKGRALTGAVIYGSVNFGIAYAFAYWGLQKAQPGMGQVLLATVPLLTLLTAVGFRQEKFNRRALLGSLVAIGGIAVVFAEEIQTNVPWPYLAALFISAVCFAFSAVYVKTVPKSDPIATNAVGMAAGAVILFLTSLLFGEPRAIPTRTSTWLALVYLTLLGSVAMFTLVLYVLKRWKASTNAYSFVLLPFVTLTGSALINHERLTLGELAGAVLVIAGTYYGALRTNGGRVSQPDVDALVRSAPAGPPITPELAVAPQPVEVEVKK